MSHLDEELRLALRREEPPAGFAERVLERLPAAPPAVVRMPARGRTATRFALAAAAALAVAATSTWLAIPRGTISNRPDGERAASVQPTDPPAPPQPTAQFNPIGEVGIVEPPRSTSPARTRHVPRKRAPDAEAIRAAEQLELALQIAGGKLKFARQEVRETLFVPPS